MHIQGGSMIEFKPFFVDIETLGLDPFESRLIAIGYDNGTKEVLINEDEKELIENFLDVLNDNSKVVLIGYNIIGFDLPFLIARGLKHGIQEVQKLRTGYIIDLMDVVSRYLTTSKRRWIKQKEICSFLGLDTRDVIDGSEIPRLFEQKEFEKIKQHCLNDLRLTKELFLKLKDLVQHKFMAKYGFYQKNMAVILKVME